MQARSRVQGCMFTVHWIFLHVYRFAFSLYNHWLFTIFFLISDPGYLWIQRMWKTIIKSYYKHTYCKVLQLNHSCLNIFLLCIFLCFNDSNESVIILQVKILNQQLDDKNIEIRDIRAQVQKNNEKIHSLDKTIGKFCFAWSYYHYLFII